MKNVKNPLLGTWRIEGIYTCDPEQGWMFFPCIPENVRWTFTESGQFDFPDEGTAFVGTLEEHFGPDDSLETFYACYAGRRLLYIERSEVAEDGFVDLCVTDRYRIECTAPDECWLYDLEDVDREPEEYRFVLKIRKIISCRNGAAKK